MKREERERLGKLLYELERKEFKDSTIPWEEYSDKGGYRRIAQAFAEDVLPKGVMFLVRDGLTLHLFECHDDSFNNIIAAGARLTDDMFSPMLGRIELHRKEDE